GLRADELILRPIIAADARLGCEAVMDSREYLRQWEQSTGRKAISRSPTIRATSSTSNDGIPRTSHSPIRSFTYTMLDPSESLCLGCVYNVPPDGTLLSRREIIPTAGGAGEWSDIDAAVYHWVREREMDAGIDETVLTELEEWIRQEWGLDRIVFVTNAQFGTQTDLFQRFGFGREFKIRRPDAEGTYFGYGPQASKAKPMSIQPRSGLTPQSPDPR